MSELAALVAMTILTVASGVAMTAVVVLLVAKGVSLMIVVPIAALFVVLFTVATILGVKTWRLRP